MLKILVPTDGSEVALRAVSHVVQMAASGVPVKVYLLHVRPPLPRAVTTFVPAANVKDYHEEESRKALREADELLKKSGVDYEVDHLVGEPAEKIAERAVQWEVDQIVMGTRGLSPIPNLLLGSTTTKLLSLTTVPVTLVK